MEGTEILLIVKYHSFRVEVRGQKELLLEKRKVMMNPIILILCNNKT